VEEFNTDIPQLMERVTKFTTELNDLREVFTKGTFPSLGLLFRFVPSFYVRPYLLYIEERHNRTLATQRFKGVADILHPKLLAFLKAKSANAPLKDGVPKPVAEWLVDDLNAVHVEFTTYMEQEKKKTSLVK